MSRWLIGMLFAIAISIGVTSQAQAAEPTIAVSPSIRLIDLSQAGALPQYTVRLQNLTDQSISLVASSLDITGQAADGSTVFKLVGQNTDHAIGSSLRYDPATLTIPGRSSRDVIVTIDQPEKLEPGGHYGAAIFTAASGATDQSVGVRQAVSSLVFVTTQSGGIKTIGQPTFDLPRFSWQLPKSATIIVPNIGNTQVSPSGTLQLLRHGQLIGSGQINIDSNLILPGQNRLFTTVINRFGSRQLAGRYQAELHLWATPNGTETVVRKTFIYVNPWFATAILGLVAIVLAAGHLGRRQTLHKRHKN